MSVKFERWKKDEKEISHLEMNICQRFSPIKNPAHVKERREKLVPPRPPPPWYLPYDTHKNISDKILTRGTYMTSRGRTYLDGCNLRAGMRLKHLHSAQWGTNWVLGRPVAHNLELA